MKRTVAYYLTSLGLKVDGSGDARCRETVMYGHTFYANVTLRCWCHDITCFFNEIFHVFMAVWGTVKALVEPWLLPVMYSPVVVVLFIQFSSCVTCGHIKIYKYIKYMTLWVQNGFKYLISTRQMFSYFLKHSASHDTCASYSAGHCRGFSLAYSVYIMSSHHVAILLSVHIKINPRVQSLIPSFQLSTSKL